MATLRSVGAKVLGSMREGIADAHARMELEVVLLPHTMATKHAQQRAQVLAKREAESLDLARKMQDPEFAQAFNKRMEMLKDVLK